MLAARRLQGPAIVMTQALQATSRNSDPYRLHRLALLPLREPAASASVTGAIEAAGTDTFFEFLGRHGLAQLWREYLERLALPEQFDPWRNHLRKQARLTAAHQMLQRQELAVVAEALDAQRIPWFLFKGADLRSWLYPDPLLRPVSDLDLFIRTPDRQRVFDLFDAAGYELRFDPETSSHEATLLKGHVSVDLHWHLFRPGRARPGLGDWLFAHRAERQGVTGLDATASLLVMLVHPAITKYLLSPTSLLIHQVDQARLIRSGQVDWPELARTLTWSGTKTAAWSSLYVLRELAAIEAPGGFMERLQPGPLHRAYLRQWIDRAWITRGFDRRWLVAGLFSLALQDSVRDAWGAWRGQRRARSNPPLADLP